MRHGCTEKLFRLIRMALRTRGCSHVADARKLVSRSPFRESGISLRRALHLALTNNKRCGSKIEPSIDHESEQGYDLLRSIHH